MYPPGVHGEEAAGRGVGRAWWAVLLIVLTAVHVGFPLVRPLHLDSILAGGKVLLTWPELWEDARVNAFTPLWIAGLKAFTGVFGVQMLALHAPAMAAAIATPFALAWAVRPWVREGWVRFLAASLAGVHGLTVVYGSGFAKPYTTMWLLMVVGAGAYVRAFRAATGEGPTPRHATVAFAGCSLAASQLHFPGIVLPLVCMLHVALWRRRLVPGTRLAARVGAVLGGSLALYLVWWSRMATRVVDRIGMNWIADRTLTKLGEHVSADVQWMVFGTVRPTLNGVHVAEKLLSLVLLSALLLAACRWAWRRTWRPEATFLVLWLVVPVLSVAALDRFAPLYYVRYVATAVFPAAVLAALVVRAAFAGGRPVLGGLALALLVAGRMQGLVALERGAVHRDWRHVYLVALAEAAARDVPLVVLDGWMWPHVWQRYVDAIDGPPPPGVQVRWVTGVDVPGPADLKPLISGRDRILIAGYPRLTECRFPGGAWVLEHVGGAQRVFDTARGVVGERPVYAIYRRPR